MPLQPKRPHLYLSFIPSLIIFFCTPMAYADNAIAKLTNFSGTVLIKSHGAWGVEPKLNLPLYSEDKVVTRIGNATITFNDGAVLKIKNNSNILIEEREKEKGLTRKVKAIERRVLLFLGKLMFKTGKEKVETRFETSTAVLGIRGTAGILSIGPDGRTYIHFTEGAAAYLIGDFIEGVAIDVPVKMADLNPVQRATFVANAAADQLTRTEAKFVAGLVPQAQVALAKAIADEVSARELLAYGEYLLESPDAAVVEGARKQIIDAKKAIEDAKKAQQDAIRDGADPAFKIFTPDDPG
ncbi:FecR domain-containing protein, partial [bacterium]|nr:FecR domain-containing protein [bacterium]